MTKIAREDLLARLGKISPALAASEKPIPIGTHFCFTGNTVFAYNDRIGMSTPLKTDFVGAIPGKVLLALLNSSLAKNVAMATEIGSDSTLIVGAESSRWKLAMLPKEQFIEPPSWQPTANDMPANMKAEKFIAGLEHCLRSVSNKDPEQNGITIVSTDSSITLYATNRQTLSTVRFKVQPVINTLKQTVMLPEEFCRQFIAIGETGSTFEVKVRQTIENKSGYALATGSGIVLFGRLLNPSTPHDFPMIMAEHLPKGYQSRLVEMPDKLARIIDGALAVMDNSDDQAATTISVKQRGIMTFQSQSRRGTVNDSMQIDTRQEEVTIRVEPKHLKTGYDPESKWLVTEDAIIVAKGNSLFLIGRLANN